MEIKTNNKFLQELIIESLHSFDEQMNTIEKLISTIELPENSIKLIISAKEMLTNLRLNHEADLFQLAEGIHELAMELIDNRAIKNHEELYREVNMLAYQFESIAVYCFECLGKWYLPASVMYASIGFFAFDAGDLKKAKEYLNKGLEIKPNFSNLIELKELIESSENEI